MTSPNDRLAAEYSRVDEHVKELLKPGQNPRELAAAIAGTSEETARLFSSGHTLAQDNTGPGGEE